MNEELPNIWLLVGALLVGMLLGGQLMAWIQAAFRAISQLMMVALIVGVIWFFLQQSPVTEDSPQPEVQQPASGEWWSQQ